MSELAADRRSAVNSLIRDVRAIVGAGPLGRDSLARIRARLLPLAARPELWAEADYPAPPEGKAKLRERETVAVMPGDAIALMPDDIHSVEIRDDAVIRHLHFYGRPLETLDRRLAFDPEKGTFKVMEMAVKTKT